MADYIVNSRIPKEIKLRREKKILEVYFDDGAPIFYKQKRIGINNSIFILWKFQKLGFKDSIYNYRIRYDGVCLKYISNSYYQFH